MSSIRTIRQRLDVTQAELAAGIDVTQGSVSAYEGGHTDIPPRVAARLILFARGKGRAVSFDEIYAYLLPLDTPNKRAARRRVA